MRLFADAYRGRRVLVTGHTGFKGSWLALWLHRLGARVTGVSLQAQPRPCHWEALTLPIEDRRLDIREVGALRQVFAEVEPDVVFHLAAQALVRRSYRDPLDTWSTNVLGTANLLEACRETRGVKAIVVVTSDKCYENREWLWAYRESDRLGGHDPYSASKAATELVAATYRKSYFGGDGSPLLATARAGNVIGGGDWAEDRLIPDLMRSIERGQPMEVRFPNATRPWQHVLEPLSGYLVLGQRLLEGDRSAAEAWNFGPSATGDRAVVDLLRALQVRWPTLSWHASGEQRSHEAGLLRLDSSKANRLLQWVPVWSLEEALDATACWYEAWQERAAVLSAEQLEAYIQSAVQAEARWTQL